MSDHWLSLYHQLPAPAQAAVAAAKGYWLRRARYGRTTAATIDEALARERWTHGRWHAYRDERLSWMLHFAAQRVPYYRAMWEERRRAGDRRSWSLLENWPFLEKEAVRSHPELFVPDTTSPRRLWSEHTSGTTGKPLSLWRSPRALRGFYAIAELRERRWHGVTVDERWAILGGQLIAPIRRRTPPFWVWNPALSQLYMSVYHLAPDLAPFYVQALERHRITYLWGYPSALATLAQYVTGLGLTRLPMRVAISSAEPVLPSQREVIAQAFGCRLIETYGSAELVVAASECPAGVLHLWPEIGVTEVFEGDRPVPPGTHGELVCTTLLNDGMPLVRYRTGDRGALAPEHGPCACGRTLPALASVEGRSDDLLVTRDGRIVGRLDPVFKADLPVHEAQIVQETLDRIRVNLVPAPGFDEAARTAICRRVQDRLGPVHVSIEPMDRIPRTAQGKFRAVVCCLPRDQRPDASPSAAAL